MKKLTEIQDFVLRLIKKNTKVTYKELSDRLSLSISSIQGATRALSKKGFIKERKVSVWILTGKK